VRQSPVTSDASTTDEIPSRCSTLQSPESETTWDEYCGGECQALIYVSPGSPSSVTVSFTTEPSTLIPITFRMHAAVDDHYENALPYTLDVSLDGELIADDVELVELVHGSPLGGPFSNLMDWELPIPEGPGLRADTHVVTLSDLACPGCGAGDWLVVAWSEMDVCPAP
jgi:hypothetical protein